MEENQKRIEQNQKRIEANDKLLENLKALRKHNEQQAVKEEKASQSHHLQGMNDPICEMDFFIGKNKPVRVQMSHPFWGCLQDSNASAWTKILNFVDTELERRETEGD